MLCVVLAAGTAMAAQGSITSVGTAGVVNVAIEASNAARNFQLTTTGIAANNALTNAPVLMTVGASLNTNSTLTVTFTNMAFANSDSVGLCEITDLVSLSASSSILIAQTTTGTNALSVTFSSSSFTQSIASGTKLFLTDNAVNGVGLTCNGSNGQLNVQLAPTPITSAVTAKVTFTDSSGDAPTAALVANYITEYATNSTGANSLIDYLGNAANGSQFPSAANLANAANVAITNTAMTYGAVTGLTSGAGLVVSAMLRIQDTASWAAVKDVYLQAAACTGYTAANTGGTNNAALLTGAGTGLVNISMVGAAFNGSNPAAYSGNVCIDVVGNQVITPRTISGYVVVTAGAANFPAAGSPATLETWAPNGYQGIIPYVYGGSNLNTVCVIANKGATAAPITFATIATESGAALQTLSLGSVAAGGTVRVDIPGVDNSSTTLAAVEAYTYTQDSTAGGTGTVYPLNALVSDRFAAQFTVGGSPTAITMSCVQKNGDSTGTKRNIPILQNATSSSSLWLQ
jgi:hypothetical protein